MELLVFDLDGTLLNRQSTLSDFTRTTLSRLRKRGIAYTVATGRTLHASRELLAGQGFELPHIYKNGVVIWQPHTDHYSHTNLLTLAEVQAVLEAYIGQGVAPFIFTIEPGNQHGVYHAPLKTDPERRLAHEIRHNRGLEVLPLADIPGDAEITNVSSLGQREALLAIERQIASIPHLVAYAGDALEGQQLRWLDIHHSDASKGNAVARLKAELKVSQVICFGDSENDLSMFDLADECYAPSNAKDSVKAAASAIIGHHDEDGIARFLTQRFDL